MIPPTLLLALVALSICSAIIGGTLKAVGLVGLSLIVSFVCAAITAYQVEAWIRGRQRRARVRDVEFVARLLELRVCARWRLRCGWSVFDDRGCIAIEGEAPDRYRVGREVRATSAHEADRVREHIFADLECVVPRLVPHAG